MRIELDLITNIAIFRPEGKLTVNDFKQACLILDPQIKTMGKLNGLIIQVASFPGWESLPAMVKHIQFVNNHHQDIAKVAFVTDSIVKGMIENIASHFVAAEIKTFAYSDIEPAKHWILDK